MFRTADLKNFILDVDGVMTNGQFIYTAAGKLAKVFGPHDADGLKMLRNRLRIQFISADKRGYEITHRRICADMGYELTFIPEEDRLEFIHQMNPRETIFMGDGYYDAPCIKACAIGIAPANARIEAIKAANFVTPNKGGEGAVMDACLYIKQLLELGDMERLAG